MFFYTQIPSHTHSRGLQNITGSYYVAAAYPNRTMSWDTSGAFGRVAITEIGLTYQSIAIRDETINYATYVDFDASKAWTGVSRFKRYCKYIIM